MFWYDWLGRDRSLYEYEKGTLKMESSEMQKFFNDTLDHLEKMEKKLTRLKIEPDNQEILNSIFNSLYTIRRSSKRFGTKYKMPPSESIKHLLKILCQEEKRLNSKIVTNLNNIKNQIERIYHHIAYIFF